jgi:hypothetical protein
MDFVGFVVALDELRIVVLGNDLAVDLGVDLGASSLTAVGVPFFFVPSPLTFFEIMAVNLSSVE